MSTYTDVELPVTRETWHWAMDRDRVGQRRRIEGEIAVRWLRRFVERTRSTVTSDPEIMVAPDCFVGDHWMRNRLCLIATVRVIRGGRAFALPDRLTTSADVVAFPVPDEPIEVAR